MIVNPLNFSHLAKAEIETPKRIPHHKKNLCTLTGVVTSSMASG